MPLIRQVALSLKQRRLVTIDEQKLLKVWDVDSLNLLSARELPKKANRLLITDDETILVADKFGDVFSYPMEAPEIPPVAPKPKNSLESRKSVASHSNPSLGTLVVGHASSLLCMMLSRDQRYLVTADRDEHIRVSHYPRGYDIERYCLGHTKYISAIHISRHSPRLLVSGGGDRDLCFWDYLKGTLLHRLEIWDVVYGRTKVSSQRQKWKRMEAKRGNLWRGRRKPEGAKGKSKNSQKDQAGDEDEEMQMTDENHPDDVGEEHPDKGDASERPDMRPARARLEEVIAVSKIETLYFRSQHALLFSAFGSNGLFFVPCDANTGLPSQGSIFVQDFPAPVLDFAVCTDDESGAREGMTNGPVSRVYVSIDTGFQAEEDAKGTRTATNTLPPGTKNLDTDDVVDVHGASSDQIAPGIGTEIREAGEREQGIHLLEWRGGDTMVRVASEASPLLAGLQRIATSPATLAEIRALDLYGALTALPKTEEMEEDKDVFGQEDGTEKTWNEQTSKDDGGRSGARMQARQKWLDRMANETRKRAVGVDVTLVHTISSSLPFDANKTSTDGPGGSGIGTVRKTESGGDEDNGPATKRQRVGVD